MTTPIEKKMSEEQLQELIGEADTGGRNPHGGFSKKVLFFVPLRSHC